MVTYPDPGGQAPGYRAAQTIFWACQMMGRPYLWGAGGPNSFDCSGLVYFCASYGGGVNHPADGNAALKEATSHRWTTATIQFLGDSIPKGQEQPGDLVMPDPGHVGICVGNHQIINAPNTGDVVRIDHYSTVYSVRRIFTPASQADTDALTQKGTRTKGAPVDVSGKLPSSEDPGSVIPVSPIDLVKDTLNTLLDPLKVIARIFAWLAVGHNWMRIGEVLGGSVLLVVAFKEIAGRVR